MSPNDDLSRLRPACDPPLKAGFVFLGSRLLANQREHSAPTRARSQFGRSSSRQSTKLIELRMEGAVFEPPPNSLKAFQSRQVRDDAFMVRVLAGTGKAVRVVHQLGSPRVALLNRFLSHHALRLHGHHE